MMYCYEYMSDGATLNWVGDETRLGNVQYVQGIQPK